MTRFTDGPAAGVTLMLRRAPVYLRAVQSPAGEWDALDQLDDVAGKDERIVVYHLVGDAGWMHIRARKGGGFYTSAEYRLVEPPPADADVRDTTTWRAWAQTQMRNEAQPA